MKFAYIDESGDASQGDVFVMAGLLIDAYRLRRYVREFDQTIREFLARHPGAPKELKTSALINGAKGWNAIDPVERKQFLTDVCALGGSCSKIFGIGISFNRFHEAAAINVGNNPFAKNYWLATAMFTGSLIQKKMQTVKNNKGLSVLIFDDNKREMPKLSDGLYLADAWHDGLYQRQRGKKWIARDDDDRFDQIVDSAFAIKSEHSSLIQVADAVCYVYRRHLELHSQAEQWEGEQDYYSGLTARLDRERMRLGRTPPNSQCCLFYDAIRHPNWDI